MGNSPDGVELLNDETVEVGGSGAQEGNLISGNLREGIYLNSGGHVVQGNRIGTDVTGMLALPNAQAGVYANGQTANQIGGTGTPPSNVISGNVGSGVVLAEGASGSNVQGNFIGTNAAGTGAVPNGSNGVVVVGGTGNLIGGGFFNAIDGGGGNVISGNGNRGVALIPAEGPDPDTNDVTANLIGVGANGTDAIGNGGEGIYVNGGSGNTIGAQPQGGNVVANNGGDGVFVEAGTGNEIRSNSIFSNAGLGIDLGPDGVTANDGGDGDTGANQLQNFPVVASLANGAASGTLSAEPSKMYTVEFFRVAACDASGNGEGQTRIGTEDVTTDGSGTATFTHPIPNPAASDVITATATDQGLNTSEFSACQPPKPAPTENPPPTTSNPPPTTNNPPPTTKPPPSCKDRRDPITTLKRPGLRGTGGNVHISARATLPLTGTARDRPSCPSGIRKVQVSLARVNGRTGVNCRFIRRQDRYVLTAPKNCRKPTLYRAKGTAHWKFTFDLELKPGDYRAQARATDKAGNKETPQKRRNIIDFTVK